MNRISKIAAGIFAVAAASVGPACAALAAEFDAHNPEAVLSVLVTNGASGEMKVNSDGSKYIEAKAGQETFEVDFYKCDKPQAVCATAAYQQGYNSELATIDQINSWNRWVLFCPAYLTVDKHPHIWMAVAPSVHDTREDVIAQQNDFMGCLRDFDRFTDDPLAFIRDVIDKK